jgi:hypothetical protein
MQFTSQFATDSKSGKTPDERTMIRDAPWNTLEIEFGMLHLCLGRSSDCPKPHLFPRSTDTEAQTQPDAAAQFQLQGQ